MTPRHLAPFCLLLSLFSTQLHAQRAVPPYDLWNSQVLADIRNQNTLELAISNPSPSFFATSYEVYFTSNPSAKYFDASPPYSEHTGEKITIHGYLAVPVFSGNYPALVIGHGHGGSADLNLALSVASLGYVALAIDGPQAGKSTGGPKDDNQAWISVDKGADYGYLYHYAYAGMRALTLLQFLGKPGNPYKIDVSKLGVFGASMGGIFTTYINGIDDRVKAAIVLASAGNWQHSLRDPNGWLYHGIYTGTRDQPYNGSDPLNSIENVDTDPTAITFVDYFDTIRYAARQYAPVLTVIGTHDGYFPLPNANLMQQAITSAGTQPNFEKRLWLLPNAMHGLSTTSSSESVSASDLAAIVNALQRWLDYCFGAPDRPLTTPQVSISDTGNGLHFEVTVTGPAGRLTNAGVRLYIATRIDSTVTPVRDFKEYVASRQSDRYVVQLSRGETSSSGDILTADNAIYFSTATDNVGLQVSSLVYKGNLPIDLSTAFMPTIDQYPGDKIVALPPPAYVPAATTLASSISLAGGADYQGMALTNPTADSMAVRVEAWSADGRLAAGEGLINPVFMTLPKLSQQVFLAEEWFGPGARRFNGSLRMNWSDPRATALAFRGKGGPWELEGIGPLSLTATPLLLPLAPDQDPASTRRLRIFTSSGSGPADVKVTFHDNAGTSSPPQTVTVSASGTADVLLPAGSAAGSAAWASIDSGVAVAARLEASGDRDPWSIDARPVSAGARLIQPHVEWDGIFTTRLLILNPASSPQTLTFRLHKQDGSSASPDASRTVAAGAALSETVESIFGIPPGAESGTGWFEVQSNGFGVLATALAVDPRSGAAAASPIGTPASGSWSMPYFVSGSGYWTGLALANSGSNPASFQITVYDASGAVLGQVSDSLDPGNRRTKLVSEWLPSLPANATGHIIITSAAPLSLLAYFGTNDGATLAAIPFSPISP